MPLDSWEDLSFGEAVVISFSDSRMLGQALRYRLLLLPAHKVKMHRHQGNPLSHGIAERFPRRGRVRAALHGPSGLGCEHRVPRWRRNAFQRMNGGPEWRNVRQHAYIQAFRAERRCGSCRRKTDRGPRQRPTRKTVIAQLTGNQLAVHSLAASDVWEGPQGSVWPLTGRCFCGPPS